METDKKFNQLSSLKTNGDGTLSGGFASLEDSQMNKIKGGYVYDHDRECTNSGDCTKGDHLGCTNTGTC